MNHCMGFSWETGWGTIWDELGWSISAELAAENHLDVRDSRGGWGVSTDCDFIIEAIICDALGLE